MNILLTTPAELKQFQIAHYSEMMQHPRSFEHKIFLRKELYNLKNESYERNNLSSMHSSRRHSAGVCRSRIGGFPGDLPGMVFFRRPQAN